MDMRTEDTFAGTRADAAAAGRAARLPRHGRATRLVHIGLALTIVAQLFSSLVIHWPRAGEPTPPMMLVHEYVGLAAFGFAFLYWVVLLTRRRGVKAAALFPWFSATRVRMFYQDFARHVHAALKLKLPPYEEHGPFASGVHGLGVLLMSFMAATGLAWFVIGGRPLLALHTLFGNIAWAYLIGHAALAVLHHWRGESSLGEMWTVGPGDAR